MSGRDQQKPDGGFWQGDIQIRRKRAAEMLSGPNQDTAPPTHERTLQRTPSYDTTQDNIFDISNFEDETLPTRSLDEYPSLSRTPTHTRSHLERTHWRESRTPPSPTYSNAKSLGRSAPYISDDEEVKPRSRSPPRPGVPPPYSFFKAGQKTTFFDLPLELRQKIYHHIVDTRGQIRIGQLPNIGSARTKPWHETPKTALLCTCKRIMNEAADVLYNNTKFILDLTDDENVLQRLGPENRPRLRRLQLLVLPSDGYPMPVYFDPALWEPVLRNLTAITIIAIEPVKDKEQQLTWKEAEQWRRWAGPIFEYVDEHLAEGVVVKFDDDGRPVVKEMVEKWFRKHAVTRVKTVSGDWIFIRGIAKEIAEDDSACCVM